MKTTSEAAPKIKTKIKSKIKSKIDLIESEYNRKISFLNLVIFFFKIIALVVVSVFLCSVTNIILDGLKI